MFNRIVALGVVAALLGLGPAAAGATTKHHKHHMMSTNTSAMHSHSSTMHKMQCRDKKTGRFVKCSTSKKSM